MAARGEGGYDCARLDGDMWVEMNQNAPTAYLWTGQVTCHDMSGRVIPCAGSGQDAEWRKGAPWPEPRFETAGAVVLDRLTGLVWSHDANPAEFPLSWPEAFAFVARMNQEATFGFTDWRLPNRVELRSLVSHQTSKPALPAGHPFVNVVHSWYWSSTTATISPSHAWYVNMEGGRMFFGEKRQFFLAWPVRGAGNGVLRATGETRRRDGAGGEVPCPGGGQDGEIRTGRVWPSPRFVVRGDTAIDRLTGLGWHMTAPLPGGPVSWEEGFAAVTKLNAKVEGGWRLPNINELESLADCSRHSPALPSGLPFHESGIVYWSSTTSLYEPDWAWALYLDKGAVGVGKKTTAFSVWAVRDAEP